MVPASASGNARVVRRRACSGAHTGREWASATGRDGQRAPTCCHLRCAQQCSARVSSVLRERLAQFNTSYYGLHWTRMPSRSTSARLRRWSTFRSLIVMLLLHAAVCSDEARAGVGLREVVVVPLSRLLVRDIIETGFRLQTKKDGWPLIHVVPTTPTVVSMQSEDIPTPCRVTASLRGFAVVWQSSGTSAWRT